MDSPETIELKPVGYIRNKSSDPSWGDKLSLMDWRDRAARMRQQRDSVSELVIDDSLDGVLEGIEEFSHITVVYWAHLVPPERRKTTTRVHPMANPDFPLVGVFTTGSPVRPNPILITTVRLLGRNGNTLRVTGLDALDGSPILDIKPYGGGGPRDIRVPAWIKKVRREFSQNESES